MIAIIAALVGLLLPAVQSARESARRSSCQNNSRQIGMGLHAFHDVHKAFPMAAEFEVGTGWQSLILPHIEQQALFDILTFQEDGRGNFQWAFGLPGINGDAALSNRAYNAYFKNIYVCERRLPIFRCPSSTFPAAVADISGDNWIVQKRAPTNYLGCVSGTLNSDRRRQSVPTPWGGTGSTEVIHDLDGLMINRMAHQRIAYNGKSYGGMTGASLKTASDGASKTILVGEAEPDSTIVPDMGLVRENNQPNQGRKDHWCFGSDDFDTNNQGDMSELVGSTGVPMNLPPVPPGSTAFAAYELSFGSRHRGGATFLFGDGSVRFLAEGIDATSYSAFGSRNGGDVSASH